MTPRPSAACRVMGGLRCRGGSGGEVWESARALGDEGRRGGGAERQRIVLLRRSAFPPYFTRKKIRSGNVPSTGTAIRSPSPFPLVRNVTRPLSGTNER